jgi:hypothetical protein
MFSRLALNPTGLSKISTKRTWGYLYNEYKLSAFFWEFVKMFVKVSISANFRSLFFVPYPSIRTM